MSTRFVDIEQGRYDFRRGGRDGKSAATVLSVLRRRGWLLAVCVVLSLIAGVAVLLSTHKRYSATSTLLFQNSQVTQALFGNYAVTAENDPTTIQANNLALASQPGIIVRASNRLGKGYSIGDVVNAVSVTAAGATDLVDVTATTQSPQSAAAIANAYAQATIAYQIAVQREQINLAATNLQAQIAGDSTMASSTKADLENRLSSLKAISALQTGNVQITSPAGVPRSPSGPSKAKTLAPAVVLGLLIGLLAMLAAERIDGTIKETSDIDEILDLPVIGSVPTNREFGRSASRSSFDVVNDPVIADAFALAIAQLQYFNVDKNVRSLVVASSASGEGKSTVAWGLAAVAAQTHPDSRVLLIDADLRRPRQGQLTGAAASPGLSEAVLHGDDDLGEYIQEVPLTLPDGTECANLYVMTAGAAAPNPAEILSSESFRRTLRSLEEQFSLVVVDASPTGIVSDAIPLLSQVTGVLVVTRMGVTRRAQLRDLADQLSELHVPVFGVIHNAVAKRNRQTYSYLNHQTRVGSDR